MELLSLIQSAELKLPFTSGSGLGAVLLTLIMLVAILKSNGTNRLLRTLSKLISPWKR